MAGLQGTTAGFEKAWEPPPRITWQMRAITSLVGGSSNGRWVDRDTDSCTYWGPYFVGRYGLLFESFRGPHPTRVVLGDAQKRGSPGSRDGSEPSRVRKDGLVGKAIRSKENGTNRRLPSTVDRRTVVPDPGQLPGVRALVRMLRTCHVGAVLTKRLVFGAFLGVAGRHVAGGGPDLAQLWALLLTSFTFLLWLVIGKPYVSRAVQGVETLAAVLELLTLSLALLAGQEELKTSQVDGLEIGSSSRKVEAFRTAMLVLQLLAIVAQTGYQWWAVLVELKARWAVWAWEREKKAVDQKKAIGRVTDRNGERDQTGGKRSTKGERKKRAEVIKANGRDGRERKPIRRARSGGDGQDGTLSSKEETIRREEKSGEGTERKDNAKSPRIVGGRGVRKAGKVPTSPTPRRTESGDGDLHVGGLKRRVSRSDIGTGQEKTLREERDAVPPVRSRADLDGGFRQENGERNGAYFSEEVATAGNSGGAYWEDARIRDWAGHFIENPVAGRHDTEGLARFGGVKWFVNGDNESEDPGGVLGGQNNVKRNGTESKASGGDSAVALVSGLANSITRVDGGQNNKLLRLKSRRQERGASSLTVFLVSEDESEEREGAGALSEESLQVVVRQTTVASFKFEDA
jgi:hypothetical protein